LSQEVFVKVKVLLALLLLFLYPHLAYAQEDNIQPRILILLDGSGSMRQPLADGQEKFKVGCEVLMRIVDSIHAINPGTQFSLRVFGHQHPVSENDCHDSRQEVPYARNNMAEVASHLKAIHPFGVSPIAWSLKEAAEKDISDEELNAYSVILMTDGVESCGGDICDVMQKLVKKKVFFKPYVIGLEVGGTSFKKEYECIGEYLRITTEKDKAATVNAIVNAVRPALKMSELEYNRLLPVNQVRPNMVYGTLAKSRLFEMQKTSGEKGAFKEAPVTSITMPSTRTIRLPNGDTYNGQLNEYGKKVKGIYTWTNHEKYKGSFKADKKDGHGIYTWPNGDFFDGEWKDDEPVKGALYVLLFNDNQELDTAVFEGTFTEGRMSGYGVSKNRLFTYEGNWENNKKNGQGKGRWVDGRTYDGMWANDKRTGHGIYILANGDRYEGEWKDNLKVGKANVQMANGDKYEGVYTNDKLQGMVTYLYANGDKYEGNYKDDSMSGHGVYTWANGNTYDGEWKKDVKNGHGVFKAVKGETYDGEWKDNAQNGTGTCIWAGGDKYTGHWKDNMRDGPGTCIWTDGAKYVGFWKLDKMNGPGTYTTAQGKRYDGPWENDVFKGKQPAP
jgi:hypothetical protein